jgi:hypothetical protein
VLNQYNSQRFRNVNGRRVGTVPVGEIVYIQDARPLRGFTGPVVCRNPWIVEAWLPRFVDCTGRYASGGHLAVVRSLRNGRREVVADWLLLMAVDENLVKA